MLLQNMPKFNIILILTIIRWCYRCSYCCCCSSMAVGCSSAVPVAVRGDQVLLLRNAMKWFMNSTATYIVAMLVDISILLLLLTHTRCVLGAFSRANYTKPRTNCNCGIVTSSSDKCSRNPTARPQTQTT